MKNLQIKGLSAAVAASVILAACNPLGKMVKNAGQIKYEVTPNPLEMHADSVAITVSGKFPANYFHKKAMVTVTPTLSGDGSKKELKPISFRGEGTDGEGNVVNTDKVAYDKAMQVSTLDLKLVGSYKGKQKEFPMVKVANGVTTTPYMVKINPKPVVAKDNFTKTVPKNYNADIHYLVNSSAVQPKELSQDDMKGLTKYVETGNKSGLVFKGVKIEAYASPDGEISLNDNLANDRAKSASNTVAGIFKKAKVKAAEDKAFYTNTGKGEDWAGFKEEMQKSNVTDKELIIRILEMYSDLNKREQEIKNLAKTYLEVADKILPKLRRSQVMIMADMPSRSDDKIKQLAASSPDSLSIEELLYGATLVNELDEKLKYYQSAAKVHPKDWRGHNNVGYVYLMQNKVNEAKAEFSKAKDLNAESNIVKNNLGVVALLQGDIKTAEENFKAASGAGNEVSYNLGIINVKKASYSEAVSNFSGDASFNGALAQLLNKDFDGAMKTIEASDAKASAEGYYLKAVIGARKKDVNVIVNNLKSAIAKDASLKDKAKKDAEFINYKDNADFKTVVN
jgi:Flp pilus assembly protein TadD